MNIHDSGYIFNNLPGNVADAKQTAPAADSRAVENTPAVWQKYMQGVLDLYSDKKANFSAVPAPPQNSFTTGQKDMPSVGFTQAFQEAMRQESADEEVKASGMAPGDAANSVFKAENDIESGKILTKRTFLKEDQFPGIHKKTLQEGANPQPKIEGAPNFRKVEGEDIYGTGQPTIDGIKTVLDKAGAGPGENSKKAYWTNLREEHVIYIDGKPYTMRLKDEPTENYAGNKGKSAEQIEAEEAKLKQDILDQAKSNGGKISVSYEDENGKLQEKLVDATPDNIQTTKEVFDGLKKQGYNVDYSRTPISDEKRPENKDYDSLIKRFRQSEPGSVQIFNCHAGKGRTTNAIIAAELYEQKEREHQTNSITDANSVKDDIQTIGKNNPNDTGFLTDVIRYIEDEKKSSAKTEADKVIAKNSGVYDLKNEPNKSLEKLLSAKDPKTQIKYMNKYFNDISRYGSIVDYNRYLDAQFDSGFSQSFEQWQPKNPGRDVLSDMRKQM